MMENKGKKIVIAHSKGGSRKTTTAWHLANGLKQNIYAKGRKVLIVDVDVQKTITIVNDIRSTTELEYFRVFQPQTVAELLEIFETHKDDIIVVDTGGFDKDINRVAIEKADEIIVPLSATIHDILGLSMFTSILDEIATNIAINVLLVGVHHKQTNFTDIEEIISDNPRAKLLKSKILSKNANFTTMAKGMSVYNTKDNVELCKRYNGVIDELIGH